MLITLQKDFDVELHEVDKYGPDEEVEIETHKDTIHNLTVNSGIVTIDASAKIFIDYYEVCNIDGDYLGAVNAELEADLTIRFKQDELVNCWFHLNSPIRIWNPQVNVSNITLDNYNIIDGTSSNINSKALYEQLNEMLTEYYTDSCTFTLALS